MRARVVIALVFGLLALAVAGCGGSDEASPTAETVEGTVATETAEATTEEATTEEATTEEATTEEATTEEATTEETETGGGGGAGDPTAGKDVFATAGCGSCHTLSDAGTSGTIGPNLDDAKPPVELVVERVTNGQGAMPSFADQLSEQEIQNVAAYVVSATQ